MAKFLGLLLAATTNAVQHHHTVARNTLQHLRSQGRHGERLPVLYKLRVEQPLPSRRLRPRLR